MDFSNKKKSILTMNEMSNNRDRSPIDGVRDLTGCKVYVSNLSFEAKEQELKELFIHQVGEVIQFDLFKNERGQSRGCGIMEMASNQLAKDAIKTMDKFLWRNRKMYVKVSEDSARDEYGRIIAGPKARVDKSDITNAYRIFVSNLPLDIKWQDVKDIFRNQIGDVSHCKMFTDQSGRPRGCGILEFVSVDLAQEAIRKMNKQDVRGRNILVQQLTDEERDKFGYVIKNRNAAALNGQRGLPGTAIGNTYGLTPEFLFSLGIDGPLHTKLHVTNLEFRVDEKKLRQVFRIAGQVVAVEICRDSQGSSRGFGTVIFNHPLEAVQAISMLNNQTLYERVLNVRFDREPDFEDPTKCPFGLPEGLGGVGMGLGPSGEALTQFPVMNDSGPSSNMWDVNPLEINSDPARAAVKTLQQIQPALNLLASQISGVAQAAFGGNSLQPQQQQQGYGFNGQGGGGDYANVGLQGGRGGPSSYNMGPGGFSNGNKNSSYGPAKGRDSFSDIPVPMGFSDSRFGSSYGQ